MVYRNKNFTVNFIEGIKTDAVSAIINACHKAANHLGLKETDHVLVTALPTSSFRFGYSEQNCGFGVYMSGAANIWIAAKSPEELEKDRDLFLKNLEKTVIHEFVHHSQYIKEELIDEDIAEKVSDDIYNSENFLNSN